MQKDKQIAILKIANIAGKVGPEDKDLLKKIEREYLVDYSFTSNPFGKRFLERVHELIQDIPTQSSCILCQKNEAENKLVCFSCMKALRIKATLFDKEINRVLGIDAQNARQTAQGEAVPMQSILFEEGIGGDVEGMDKEVYDKFLAESKASDRYVENLVRNLDSSMERLASRKEIKDNKKLLIAVLIISIINTISIIVIAVLVFITLKLYLT